MITGEQDLNKSLKTRHMTMITIGGSIGTLLFIASGAAVNQAGPGGATVAYAIMGIMVFFLMTSLGEMATYLPNSGSFNIYASRFFEPALGFAMGWTYWYSWATTVAFEVAATAIIMKFWLPDVPGIIISVITLVLLFGLSMLSTKIYGETQYWLSIIKVITIIVFLVVGVLTIIGIFNGQTIGFSNWTIGDAPFVGGVSASIGAFLIAGFSFMGTEVVGTTAGESENPKESVPKAIKTVFWRIMLFYIGTIVVIACIVPYTDPRLIGASTSEVAMSPFVIVFERIGIASAAAIVNAVILTSVLSCGNSCMYVAARTLFAMAKEGIAPKLFLKLNSKGVPVNAVYFTTVIGAFAFLCSIFGENTVYLWLLNCSAITGFIAWVVMGACHIRFRQAYIAQGNKISELVYKAPLYPFGPYLAVILCMIVIFGQSYFLMKEDGMDWGGFAATYIGVVIFGVCYLGYKLKYKTKLIPANQIDITTDSRKVNNISRDINRVEISVS